MSTTEVLKKTVQITDSSVFLNVRFGMIGNTRKVKLDKEDAPSHGITVTTDADQKLLKAQKTLLESDELEAIRRADQSTRVWIDKKCHPYEMGIRILPNTLLTVVQNRLEEYQAERKVLVDAFAAVYPKLCATAAERLGSLYNPDDYPSVDSLAELFTFDWQYVSFGVPDALKSAGLFEQESAKMQERFQTASEEITAIMRESLLKTVSHLKDVLTPTEDGKPKRLFKSAVKNVQEFLEDFNARNITNDEELAEVVAKARALVDGVTVEDLKKSEGFKEQFRAGMESLTGQLSGLVETVQGRKLRL